MRFNYSSGAVRAAGWAPSKVNMPGSGQPERKRRVVLHKGASQLRKALKPKGIPRLSRKEAMSFTSCVEGRVRSKKGPTQADFYMLQRPSSWG